MEVLIGILIIGIGVLLLIIQIKKYIDGYKYKEDNTFGKAANGELWVIAISAIIAGLIIIS